MMEQMPQQPRTPTDVEAVMAAAAKDVLDRIGVSKTDKVEVKAPQGIFLLPRKNDEEDGTEEGTNDI